MTPDRAATPGAPAAEAAAPPATHRLPDFDEALREAARIAVLSPSSHNCQPWAVAWARSAESRAAAARLVDGEAEASGVPAPGGGRGDGTYQYLVLGLDRSRELRSLPAHAVEMLLSCGLYWQLLLRALEALGWSADALHFAEGTLDAGTARGAEPPGTAWPGSWTALCVARLRRRDGEGAGAEARDGAGAGATTGAGAGAGTDAGAGAATVPGAEAETHPADRDGGAELRTLRAAARARRTNRAPYLTQPVRPALLDGLLAPSGCAAARDADVTVRHLTSGADRAAFADFVAAHGGRDFSHREAWRETHAYLRADRAEATACGDGFALDQLFGPLSWPSRLALRAALAPATMRLLGPVGYDRLVGRSLARGLARMVRPTPVVVAMSFGRTEPTLADAVKGGARLADYWLCATTAGLALHPVSVVLQHEDLRAAFQSSLRIPGRAFFVSRLGWPVTEFPPSPRRPADAHLRRI
ncbi:RedV protein [Streptomyces flavofungini]|uniref:RedV protein n=1 Tax=Streptomyces flavofungini TaxID=68200 RepID=A0ABS0X279_9ACTN|nr:RedV protein [Streptomyces flavofungini]MBJ3807136.1 RedV protein [Streptomyces flavofungini]GHC74807.1 RedV protein [Streptomyces flavofungini]